MIPRKQSTGDPPDFTTKTRGKFIDAVEALREQQFSQPSGDQWHDTIPIGNMVNATSSVEEAVPWYGIVSLRNAQNDPHEEDDGTNDEIDDNAEALFKSFILFDAYKPLGYHDEFLGIAQEPINPDSNVANVLVWGVTQARVLFTEDTVNDNYAVTIEGDIEKLAAAQWGPVEILWSPGVVGVKWCIVRLEKTPPIGWAKAQIDWQENGVYPNGYPKVICKTCDWDGNNVRGEEFDVHLPRNPRPVDINDKEHDADPAVYQDWVIGYSKDIGGLRICTTPYLHKGKIWDIKIIGDSDTIPTGWNECDGSLQSGWAGTQALVSFNNTGGMGTGEDFACVPRQRNAPVGTQDIGIHRDFNAFDHIGAVVVPDTGDVETTNVAGHTHEFNVQCGEQTTVGVLFIQRYK